MVFLRPTLPRTRDCDLRWIFHPYSWIFLTTVSSPNQQHMITTAHKTGLDFWPRRWSVSVCTSETMSTFTESTCAFFMQIVFASLRISPLLLAPFRRKTASSFRFLSLPPQRFSTYLALGSHSPFHICLNFVLALPHVRRQHVPLPALGRRDQLHLTAFAPLHTSRTSRL